MHADRKVKLTPQKYFSARIMQKGGKFSQDSDYVFVSQQFLEMMKVEKQIDVAMSKGNFSRNGNEVFFVPEANAMNIFRDNPGSPSYWRKMRGEIFARMEQLGPFHFFFTLSCAEKKWKEVQASLLQLTDNRNVIFDLNADGELLNIYVGDRTLEEFVEENKPEMRELYYDKFIHVTRLFDDRLKAFKKVFLESNDDIAHYCYRIEFQARGESQFHSSNIAI